MKSLLLKIMLICGMSLGAATYSHAGILPPGSGIRALQFQASSLVNTEVTVFDDECAKALAALIDDRMYIVGAIGSSSPILTEIAVVKPDITAIIAYSLARIWPPGHAFLSCGFFNSVDGETGLCDDGINNDNDSFTDCADPDCEEDTACGVMAE
jgi:hypothetical protein